jgi:hypothetical protein
MSDQFLEQKFQGLAEGILSADQTRRVIDLCWRADQLADIGEIARAARKA